MLWNPCCDCEDCSCEGCDFEECDCESCEVTCRELDKSAVKKRRTDFGDPQELRTAIINQDKSATIKIVRKGNVNLRTIYNNGDRAIHLVFKTFEEDDVIKILPAFIAKKVNLYFKNKDQETILHIAVEKKWKKAIDFMLKKGYKIEMIYKRSNPVPHFVIENEHKKFLKLKNNPDRVKIEIESASFVEWLISKGFDFDRSTDFRESALHLAIERNLQHLLPTLLKYSNNIKLISKNDNRTLLHTFISVNDACKEDKMLLYGYGQVYSVDYAQRYTSEIIKILLEKGVSVDAVDKYGSTALHASIGTNIKMGIFEMLLDHFTNVHHKNQGGKTLLHAVARTASWAESESEAECYLRIMQSLIAKGSDVNSKDKYGSTPVYEVVERKNLRAVQLMSENNADFKVTYFGKSLLHYLAMIKPYHKPLTDESHEAIFELLIKGGCEVNATNKDGESPLHTAAKFNNIVIIRKLLAHGAEVNLKENKMQKTPLHFALENEKVLEVIELLLDNGANVNAKTSLGRSPLHLATIPSDDRNIVEILLKRGANVHATDDKGETALYNAFQYNRPNVILEMLKYGANINESSILNIVEKSHKEKHCKEVMDCLMQHWIKLEAANLPHLKEFRACIKDAFYKKFYAECLKEIDLLKSTFIDGDMTFYKFLQIDPNSAYAYCEMLKKHVDSPSFDQQFPKYYVLILANYRLAMARNLLDTAK